MTSLIAKEVDEILVAYERLEHAMKQCAFTIRSCDCGGSVASITTNKHGHFIVTLTGEFSNSWGGYGGYPTLAEAIEKFIEVTEH
jgi:hypothetical protein